MIRCTCLLVILACTSGPTSGQDKPSAKKLPDGVYAVLRDSLNEKDILPLKAGEALAVHEHRYLKKADKEPQRFLVVRATPDVELDLADAPKADKDGEDVVRILLKLKPKAAAALERLTTDRLGKQVTIIVGGQVVTMHKIREAIKGGNVQITSCTPGGASFLLEQLQARQKK